VSNRRAGELADAGEGAADNVDQRPQNPVLQRLFEDIADAAEEAGEEVADALEQAGQEEAGRVGERQRIVVDVGVAVPGLQVAGVLHVWIGGQEATDFRVVDPPVHVHEVDGIDHLVAPANA
jgi:hypothetical protein